MRNTTVNVPRACMQDKNGPCVKMMEATTDNCEGASAGRHWRDSSCSSSASPVTVLDSSNEKLLSLNAKWHLRFTRKPVGESAAAGRRFFSLVRDLKRLFAIRLNTMFVWHQYHAVKMLSNIQAFNDATWPCETILMILIKTFNVKCSIAASYK